MAPKRERDGSAKQKHQQTQQHQQKNQQQQNQKEQQQSKNKRKEYIYGNYTHYYGYRVGTDYEDDPRVSFFKKEWVENKDCLDIGCNAGHVTIGIAVRYGCKSMLGVDIDNDLINKARTNLRLEKQALVASETPKTKHASNKNASDGTKPNPESTKDGNEGGDQEFTIKEHKELLGRISFRAQNYLEGWDQIEKYDTIFCLSVSKWVHLNWGDEGLIKFFSKIYRELRPGGVLVLEPQPWSSYGKKRKVSDVASANYKAAVIRPEHFPSLLTEKIGFESYEEITSQVPNDKSGFQRPLFAYFKGTGNAVFKEQT